MLFEIISVLKQFFESTAGNKEINLGAGYYIKILKAKTGLHPHLSLVDDNGYGKMCQMIDTGYLRFTDYAGMIDAYNNNNKVFSNSSDVIVDEHDIDIDTILDCNDENISATIFQMELMHSTEYVQNVALISALKTIIDGTLELFYYHETPEKISEIHRRIMKKKELYFGNPVQ